MINHNTSRKIKWLSLMLCVLMLGSALYVSGCGDDETERPDFQTDETYEIDTTSVEDMEREAHGEEETEETVSTEATEATTKSDSTLLEEVEEEYDAKKTYQDELMSMRYLILGEQHLVSVMLVGGMKNMTAVPYGEIARNEQTDVNDLTYLNFYDKNNQALTFVTKNKTAKKILEEIQELSQGK